MSNALVPEKLTNTECCSLATMIFQVVQRCHSKWNETKAKQQQRNIVFFFKATPQTSDVSPPSGNF